MAKRTQLYRVAAGAMASLIGRAGELIVNTTRNSLHTHDGITPGGFETARADLSNVADASTSAAGKMTAAQVAALATIQTPDLMNKIVLGSASQDIIVPSWARRFTLHFDSVINSGTGSNVLRIVSNGVKLTSGYAGRLMGDDGSTGAMSTTGIQGWINMGAGDIILGTMEFVLRRDDDAADYQWAAFNNNLFVRHIAAGAIYYPQNMYSAIGGLSTPIIDKLVFEIVGAGSFTGNIYARFTI